MSKVLSNRLAKLLPKLILEYQAGFVPVGKYMITSFWLKRWCNALENEDLAYKNGCSVRVPCLAFADECPIFANGSRSALEKIMDFLAHYRKVSGESDNTEKSTVVLASNAAVSRPNIVLIVTGFAKGALLVFGDLVV
ncbi:hypothetical protein LIER_41020 [Lithospermum erythrorhizon]|uniref:Uncharacterized protein n=1 Tax=Lithospermum erythrorhizon TaxID=34254 RepID=A0AAV3R4I4_LITER